MTIGIRRRDRSFVCTKDAGAVLLLPEGAARAELSDGARRRVHEYCAKHARSWERYLCARSHGAVPRPVQDLLVVTGLVCASTWAKANYSKNTPPSPARYVPPHCPPEPVGMYKAYPRIPGTYGPYPRNSCVFLLESRCKIRRRLPDVRVSCLDFNVVPEIDLETVGRTTNCHDAVEEILNYILKYSSAKVAVADTRDLRTVVSCMPRPRSPDSFPKDLKRLRPKIIVDEKAGSLDIEILGEIAEK